MTSTQTPHTEPSVAIVYNHLESIEARLDVIGQQLNWLCDNLQNMFMFIGNVSNNGGGVRGMMKAIKDMQPPQLKEQLGEGVEPSE